jgi:chromosome segregation ATPase
LHCDDERIKGLNIKLNAAAGHIVQMKKNIQLLQARYNTVQRDINNVDKLDQDLKQLKATSQANEDEIKGYKHQIIDFEQKFKEYEHRLVELKHNKDKTYTVSATPGHLVTRAEVAHVELDSHLHAAGIDADVCVDVVVRDFRVS